MHHVEHRILSKFKKEPVREISTTEIVRETHPEEYSRIASDIALLDKKTAGNARRRKGQLHRKTLYHLNNLVSEGILKVVSVRGKGEKHFALAIEQGDIIIERKRRQFVISKPTISTSLIEEYENIGIVHKFDKEGWLNRLNCILIDAKEMRINKAYDLVHSCLTEVNDCIAIGGFEQVIASSTFSNLEEILRKLDIDSKDHEKAINLLIETKDMEDDKVLGFIESYLKLKPNNIIIIFRLESKELKVKSKFFKRILSEIARDEIKLNLQNIKVHSAPILIGKAGPYTITDNEWREYQHNKGDSIGLCIGTQSLAIDLHRFFAHSTSSHAFRELVMKCAKTLLKVSANQRRKNGYLKLTDLNKHHSKKFFSCARSTIRFWNYDFSRQEHLLDLLESSRNEIKEFCMTERTIYRSCGMPINFDISFSSVFTKFSPGLSSRDYTKTTIRSFQDYHLPETVKFIAQKEQVARIFDGADRCRFFRHGIMEDLISEITFIMNTYDLPLITYDFREAKGEMKLTKFLGEVESWK